MEKNNIEGGLFTDDRGTIRFINEFPKDIKRMYQVFNYTKGCIRAWHGHEKESKYVYVPKGAILLKLISFENFRHSLDTIVIREKYIESFILSSDKPSLLYILAGHYNGFKTLTSDTIVQFFSTSSLEESEEDDHRLNWDYFGKEIWEEKYR